MARALVEAAPQWTGRVDVLVNNAVHWGGDAPSPDRPFEAVPDADWPKVLHANTEGALRLSRAVAPHMRERRWGRMVHISSNIATQGMAGAEDYAAAGSAAPTPSGSCLAAPTAPLGGVQVARVEVRELGHGDLPELLAVELGHGGPSRAGSRP